jgi:hypothetical protein
LKTCTILTVGYDPTRREELLQQLSPGLQAYDIRLGQTRTWTTDLIMSVDITSAIHLIGTAQALDIIYVCNNIGRSADKLRRDVGPIVRKSLASPHKPLVVLAEEMHHLIGDYRTHGALVFTNRLPLVVRAKMSGAEVDPSPVPSETEERADVPVHAAA